MSETYEQLRDSTTGDLAAAWKGADRREALLQERIRNLVNDNRYTEQYRAETAWKLYEAEAPKILADREKARELMEKEASYHDEMSTPRPKGESLRVGSAERLLASQNHAARVVRMAERLEAQADKNPLGRRGLPAVLRDEYAKGIETGGVEGAAACKGVLMAADELGMDRESFLRDLRGPEQLERLEQAQRYRRMAQSLGRRVAEPGIRRPGSAQMVRGNTPDGPPNPFKRLAG